MTHFATPGENLTKLTYHEHTTRGGPEQHKLPPWVRTSRVCLPLTVVYVQGYPVVEYNIRRSSQVLLQVFKPMIALTSMGPACRILKRMLRILCPMRNFLTMTATTGTI
jgi:hypothetical protein